MSFDNDPRTQNEGQARYLGLERLFRKQQGIGPNRGTEQVTTDRFPIGGQHELRNAEGEILGGHEARFEGRGRTGIMGPRGKWNPAYPGLHEDQLPGLPPVLAPFKPLDQMAKEKAHPRVPPQLTRIVDFVVTVNSGRLIDRDAGHPIMTIQIDNYTKIWLYVPGAGKYIMPYCLGVQIPMFTAPSKIEIDAAAPPGITQPAVASPNQIFSVTAIEELHEYSPGLSVLNAGALP